MNERRSITRAPRPARSQQHLVDGPPAAEVSERDKASTKIELGNRIAGALFSPCRQFRYLLWRHWTDRPRRMVAFIGLNCSTADETNNDPTVRRCIGFAKDWGYDGMYMLNAFAFRATDPAVMKLSPEPIGPDNDAILLQYTSLKTSALVVACWGNHVAHLGRGKQLRSLLRGRTVHCLGTNQNGEPKHPLYLRRDAELRLL